VIQLSQLEMLHRHGNDWVPLEPVEHGSPADHDVENRLLRGEQLYSCTECELQVKVRPQDEAGEK
jgi:hypothetical protein